MALARPVIVIGGVNVDLVMRVPRSPKPGESLSGYDFQMALGGKASNQAIGIKRLGGRPLLISRVGNDTFGSWIIDQLKELGVSTDLVSCDDRSHSGVAMITVDETGQNTIVVTSGAYGRFSPKDILEFGEVIEGAFAVMLTLEIPTETCRSVLELSRSLGVLTVLDPGPVSSWDAELLPLTDIITPNETEIQAIIGVEVGDLASVSLAAKSLIDRGARSVVIKLGDKGSLAVTETCSFHIPAIPIDKVIDTTGAGDAFNAGLIVALERGFHLKEAIAFGNCAGALAVTRVGAAPSMPWGAQVEDLFRRFYSGSTGGS